jgi:hypothetical protein
MMAVDGVIVPLIRARNDRSRRIAGADELRAARSLSRAGCLMRQEMEVHWGWYVVWP